MRHPFLCLFAFVSFGAVVWAQPLEMEAQRGDSDWLLPVPELRASAAIPTSKDVLRYEWGQEISSHHQIETYLKALARAAPDRTRLVQYGTSTEGRSLNYLVISSPQNVSSLDEIRTNNLRLADPRATDYDAAEKIIGTDGAPAIIWLAYAVHGNEISPSDAALLTAYHLLADERQETQEMLRRLVVIIDPLQNPDGRDRFVNVFRETRGRFNQSNPYANEHTERWPNGRSNHYWFDMNRDWFLQSQREVRAKVAAYLDWQPQIYVDAHEMGRNSSFYFPPAAEPKNPYLLASQSNWYTKLGEHQAGWFDRYGFGYMTREVFDGFYPGYGSEWPTLQGGLGVLWEQASTRGMVIDRDDETELTYANGVRNHYISGVATLEFASTHRRELLRSFYQARERSIQLGREGNVRHYFLLADRRPQRAASLAKILSQNGIEIRRLNKRLQLVATDTKNGKEANRVIPAGSFHISAAQPTGRLLRTLLDRTVEMNDKFLRRQLERNELRLPDEIYDVTAWSLPLSFDVVCLATGDSVPIDSSLWSPSARDKRSNFEKAKVAYLMRGSDGTMRVMSDLIQKGVRLHVCDQKFKMGGQWYDRGTLIAKVSQNDTSLHDTLQKSAAKFGVEVVPTDTAFVEAGVHMGGPAVKWVRPPKIMLVVNRPTNYACGHTWYLFDQVLSYPTTRANGRDFARIDLNRFNTIILPDGSYSSKSGFGKSCSQKLRAWISNGGTLILLRGATRWAAGDESGLLKNKIVKRQIVTAAASEDDKNSGADKEEKVTPDHVPGAFFRGNVFEKHWVTFGYDSTVDVFYTGSLILSPTKETAGRSLITFSDRDQLLTSGFCWPASLELLAMTPYVVYRSIGSGHVIGFTDDPNFRAMYPSIQRLFINAAMLGAAH